ncbi:MAG: hypothetical protein WA726_05600 [Acidimicrobiia bacterium]
MEPQMVVTTRRLWRLKAIGVVALIASVLAAALGWVLVGVVANDLRESVSVSDSAVFALGETVDLVERVTNELDTGLTAAGEGISAASSTTEMAATQLSDIADFLDGPLQSDIETLQGTMPAAVQAAATIDTTMRALSLFGVDYSPERPFDESLRAVETALEGLPAELTQQADAIRALVPTASQFSVDAANLAGSFESLTSELSSTRGVVDSYRTALDQAESVVVQTDGAVTRNTWLLRALILVFALLGSALSIGVISVGRLADPIPGQKQLPG